MPDPIHDIPPGLPRLLEIMRRLRDPQTGCPWDIEQDFRSIAPYTIEEAYEVDDAIRRDNMADLRDELGDLLLQVVYHAQMGQEAGTFDFNAIAQAISDKMIRRHPHVFGDETRDKTSDEQTRDWERIKAAERGKTGPASTLDGIALGLPGMTRAVKLQKRAARVGFDWPHIDQVVTKITEEAGELAEAMDQDDPEAVADEYGDLLFVVANLGRHLGVDPEEALRRTNAKFERRFRGVEARLALEGRSPAVATLEEMDQHWNAEKRAEKSS